MSLRASARVLALFARFFTNLQQSASIPSNPPTFIKLI
jgi:hypothetical protein